MRRTFRPTYIRQWRHERGLSLDALAARIPMDKGNLSKIERGLLPYNQDLLELLADALSTEPANLLIRDPSDPDGIWSIWDRAEVGVRRQIIAVASALITDEQGGKINEVSVDHDPTRKRRHSSGG